LIGVDTNILIRLLVRDHIGQYQAAVALVSNSGAREPLIVNPIVIAETVWVLEKRYRQERQTARGLLATLLDTDEFAVPRRMNCDGWSDWLQSGHSNFSDVVIAAINLENGCEKTVTFDLRAAKSVPGMELLA
jgi:predicted nucleic-acid-binding protein